MSAPYPTRPSPSKQHLSQLRKRRHSAVSNNASEDEDGDEPLASLNPAVKANTAGTGAVATAGATTAGGRKRAAKAAGWNPASVDLLTVGHAVDYRYSTEISQMVSDLVQIVDSYMALPSQVSSCWCLLPRFMYFARYKIRYSELCT